MSEVKTWNDIFSKKHIEEVYKNKIRFHPSVGLDKVTLDNFEKNLKENIDVIYRKVRNGTYKFTRYKQLLMPKNAEKPPRCLCVPTLRDKLTVTLLNEYLNSVYGNDACYPKMPQFVLKEVKEKLPAYTYFIKLDVKTFYASVKHDKLDSMLLNDLISGRINEPKAIALIQNMIRTPSITAPTNNRVKYVPKEVGLPEGLSVSNSLANIFLSDIDSKYRAKDNIAYWRYVDDILILLNEEDCAAVKREITDDIKKKGLELNEKEDAGKLEKGFTYLGYKISKSGGLINISVRESTVLKMEHSLEALIKKLKNPDLLKWRLDLKITGFIMDGHSYGWLFFFSKITDISLLYRLDLLVEKLLKRYGFDGKIKPKRFVRAYHEIGKNLKNTMYVPDLDNMSISEKKDLLSDIYGKDLRGLREKDIRELFSTIISKEIADIKKDVLQDIS